MERLYVSFDRYNEEYHSGGIGRTAEEWKDLAIMWSNRKGLEEEHEYFKNKDISTLKQELELISKINTIWNVYIVPKEIVDRF